MTPTPLNQGGRRPVLVASAVMFAAIGVLRVDEYAVRAFEVRAFDYLLKPFDADRLEAALDRGRHQVDLEHRPQAAALRSLLERLQTEPASDAVADVAQGSPYLERVCVQSAGRVQVVQIEDVEWIEACGNYARLHTPNSRPMLRRDKDSSLRSE